MTKEELESLSFFREGDRFLNGKPIDWASIHFPTMQAIELLRRDLDSPILLIRGAHPGETDNKTTAVDACAPRVSIERVFMALTRLPVSFGIYSGNSFHVDLRGRRTPARWMAVKVEERHELAARGLADLVTSRADGWLYLAWNDARSFEALSVVLSIAGKKAAGSAAS